MGVRELKTVTVAFSFLAVGGEGETDMPGGSSECEPVCPWV